MSKRSDYLKEFSKLRESDRQKIRELARFWNCPKYTISKIAKTGIVTLDDLINDMTIEKQKYIYSDLLTITTNGR